MQINPFFDPITFTVSYIIVDSNTKKCAIIDPVLDYDIFSGKISHKSANSLITFIKNNNLQLEWILETHIHADHLTAAHYLQQNLSTSSKIAISKGILPVLKHWTNIFNIKDKNIINGSNFNHMFQNNEIFKIGDLSVKFLTTDGHTPSCGSFLINDCVFVGDLIFMPNIGTGRTDFPNGSAKKQFTSIKKILSLPKNTQIFTGHDYPPEGQNPQWQSTILEQKEQNILAKITNQEEYIKIREEKNQNLPTPKLLFPALQINLQAGKIPKAENNKTSYLKIPLNFA